MAATLNRPERTHAAESIKPTEATADPSAEPLNPFRWIIMVAVLTGAFLELLDTTSINVALPQMAGNLGATQDEIGWVSTGYILANVVVLPLTAWLSTVFGRRRYLAFSIMLFTIASLFCGASQTLGALVFWRIIQGAGGAALLSTAQASLREVFPKDQQGMIQSIYVLVVIAGPTLGPTFGGWITDNYSWPWIFYIKAPLGFVAAFLVARFLRDSAHKVKANKADWLGIGLLAVGLGALQYVLEEGERYDWFGDVWITRLAVIAAVALTGFVAWELWPSNKTPVVNLRVLKNRELSAGSLLLLVGGFGIYGGTFIFPLFVQSILGFTPTETGLVFLPGGLANIVCVILCGRLLNGAKPLAKPATLIAIGMGIFVLSQWQLGHLTTQSGAADTQLGLIVRGIGLGLLITPLTVASLSTLQGAEIAQGAAMTNLFRQLGGSFGIAAINTYLVKMAAYHRADLVTNIFSGNTDLAARQAGVAQTLLAHGYSPTSAHAASIGIINHALQQQAQTMSYNNAFLLIGLSYFVSAPLVLLFRGGKPKTSGPPPDAH